MPTNAAGSGKPNPGQEMRDLIEAKSAELGVGMAALSRAIGKNPSYMHQFLKRRSPPWLGEMERGIVSNLLDIPEAKLVAPRDLRSRLHELGAMHTTHIAPAGDVETFLQSEAIDVGTATERLPRLPQTTPGDDMIAIRMESGEGRITAGDVVYLQRRQRPRIGDTVLALIGRRVKTWGRMLNITTENVTIDSPTGHAVLDRNGAEILRVYAIIAA